MPVYDETNIELLQSINSILCQTYKKFEFIIVDDNPYSNRIKRFLHIESTKDSRIKVLYNSKSVGPSISSNKGIECSHGIFIARMDADDICDRHRLEYQLRFIKLNRFNLICSNFRGFCNHRFERYPYYGKENIVDQNKMKYILSKSNVAMGPTLFFQRNIFIKIGGYRNIVAEDYDLVVRFIINGYLVGYQSYILLFKRNRRNNLSNNYSLNEFVNTINISRFVKNTHFRRILPDKYFNLLKCNINKRDIICFHKFQYDFNKFEYTKSLYYFFKAVIDTFLSKLVLERNLWMLFINNANKRS